ncbi:MAG TPA: TIGR01459 family HAD-type hydrolase [Kaistiaceae bacterium]|nr:TIGR01459 family HAD-type hydrolase [Kaistiaceae bacterium]
MSTETIDLLPGFSTIADRYDGILCDLWGVVHNGLTAWPEACAALRAFRAKGGHVVLLSNAPRPNWSVRPQFAGIGVPGDAFDGFVTSGDVTHDLLAGQYGGARVHHIGPERDHALFEGLDVDLVGEDRAEVVVCTGLFDDVTETPDDYVDSLTRLAGRGLAMICANPDKVVERGSDLVYCAGALADVYAGLGAPTRVIGKPHPEVYEAALASLAGLSGGAVDRARVLAIGDSVRTDLAGAAAQGIDALFVSGGIHGAELGPVETPDPRRLAELLAAGGVTPIGVQPRLRW